LYLLAANSEQLAAYNKQLFIYICSMSEQIKQVILDSITVKQQLLNDETVIAKLDAISNLVVDAFRNGKKVLFCGNGGSAADAQHLAAEFSGRFYLDREALPAEALHVNTSYLTAIANDYSFEVAYARLVKGIGHSGDVLVGLSTSGNSPNIIEAFKAAKEKGMITIGFTGETGGQLKSLSDHLFNVPSKTTPRIQESHIMLGHIICQLVEERYFATKG
jgi:D-sedoheptulose 7-phosphate isomerase